MSKPIATLGESAIRRGAFEAFQAIDLPSRRDEAWKYTDIARHGATSFALAEMPADVVVPAPITAGYAKVFANGVHVDMPRAPLPAGLRVGPLDVEQLAYLGLALPAAEHPFVALNAALFNDGLVIEVAADTDLEQAIELLSLGCSGETPVQFHGRVVVVLEKGAKATLIERHQGVGAYFSNQVVEVLLAEDAVLRHVKLQDESRSAIHLATTGVRLADRARYESVVVQLGAKLGRHEVHGILPGDAAHFAMAGAVLGGDGQHLDNTTRVVHSGLGGTSDQLIKTVLDGNAHGVFLGTVVVGEGAQKTDARQLSRTLMLSDKAAMDCKPELLIYADDVKCGHGASVGDIDDAALFYLRSRGLDEAAARQLLTEGFLVEVVDRIADETVRAAFTQLVADRLGNKS